MLTTNQVTGRWLIAATALALVLFPALNLVQGAVPGGSVNLSPMNDHIGYMLRVTARLAFGLLLLAYLARPIWQLSGQGKTLLNLRPYIGLAAALSHTVHFGYVWAYLTVTEEPTSWVTLVFGGAAFALLWAMALTSNSAGRRKLGVWWRRLHLTGMHYLWLIFMQTFVAQALFASSQWARAMSILGLIALAVRASAWLAQRLRRTA